MKYELTISCDNDAHSGVYDTYAEARVAAGEAAGIDNLIVDARTWTKRGDQIVGCSGVFIEPSDEGQSDSMDKLPIFDFRIEQVCL
jgi:hypothetical protein